MAPDTDAERETPPYARVVADIRARITGGELRPGDRVPSTREITREWGVAMATATKALTALRREGLVEAVRGVGTVVRGSSAPGPTDGSGPMAPGPVGAGPVYSGRVGSGPVDQRGPGRAGVSGSRPGEVGLTRGAIVRAAITVADAEGIDGLSMRRVSTELRVSTMALYRHVDSKDELFRAMVDEVYSELELPDSLSPEWRGVFELTQRREWALYRAHPWLVSLATITRPVMSERLMEYGEWNMRLLVDHGCSPNDALRLITILTAYMSGMALQVAQVREMERETGVDSTQFWAGKGAELALAERYPYMSRVTAPPETDIDRTFDLGMAQLLDGLAPLVDSKGSSERQER